ncbi:hypothetical protein O3G_MSEX002495 [Manduca sexta]|uniref:C-type lectin domain-containing protein n=1 Tax=Manduca sexta TaxID=7130 RepID=A0A921YNU8_MANSE|nr:hypothetical protein O3G_MSEX002495 [Manduca sexta]
MPVETRLDSLVRGKSEVKAYVRGCPSVVTEAGACDALFDMRRRWSNNGCFPLRMFEESSSEVTSSSAFGMPAAMVMSPESLASPEYGGLELWSYDETMTNYPAQSLLGACNAPQQQQQQQQQQPSAQPLPSMPLPMPPTTPKSENESMSSGRALMDVYNDWLPGEPNDVNGEESCIVMNKKGQMNDISCNRKFPFICKKTLASLEWNAHCQTPYKRYIVNEDLGRCYKFFLTPMNWTEAFAVCNAEESYLAIINSDEEANFLKKMTKDNPKYTVKGNYLAGVVMLGFHNRDRQGWLTIKGATLEDSGYTQWGYAQPDVDDKYLCGAMFYNGELTYGDCSQRSFFICEKEYKSGFDERFGDE